MSLAPNWHDGLPELRDVSPKPGLYWPRHEDSNYRYWLDACGLFWNCMLVVIAVFAFMVLIFFMSAMSVGFLFMWIVILDMMRWAWRVITQRSTKGCFEEVVPFTFAVFVLVHVPNQLYLRFGPTAWLGFLSLLFAWRFHIIAHGIASHYILYASENHNLEDFAHRDAQKLVSSAFRKKLPETFTASTEIRRLTKRLLSFRHHTFLFAVLLCGSMLTASLTSFALPIPTELLNLLIPGVLVAATLLYLVRSFGVGLSSLIRKTVKAVAVFLHSPPQRPHGEPIPWLSSSKCGTTSQRRTQLFVDTFILLVILLHAGIMTPLMTYGPMAQEYDSFAVTGFFNPDTVCIPILDDERCRHWAIPWAIVGIVAFSCLTLFFALAAVIAPSICAADRMFEDPDALFHAPTLATFLEKPNA